MLHALVVKIGNIHQMAAHSAKVALQAHSTQRVAPLQRKAHVKVVSLDTTRVRTIPRYSRRILNYLPVQTMVELVRHAPTVLLESTEKWKTAVAFSKVSVQERVQTAPKVTFRQELCNLINFVPDVIRAMLDKSVSIAVPLLKVHVKHGLHRSLPRSPVLVPRVV